MDTCFCGCGNEIGRFQLARRSANKNGAKIAQLLSDYAAHYKPWLDEGRPGFVEPPVPIEGPDEFEQYRIDVAAGTEMRDACLTCVHEIPGGSMPDKAAVKEWCNTAELVIAAARMPMEARRKFFEAVQHGTGEEIMNAFDEGVKAT